MLHHANKPVHAITQNGAQQNNAYIASAIRKYARKLRPDRVEWCAGRARGALIGLVADKKLPESYAFTPTERKTEAENILSLPKRKAFAELAKTAREITKASKNGTETPAITERELILAGMAAPANLFPLLHGKSAKGWVKSVLRPIFEALASGVEKDYGYREKAIVQYYHLKRTSTNEAAEAKLASLEN